MLSFLQEDSYEDINGAERPDSESSEQVEQEEYLTVSARSESVRKGTYVLFVLFGIGMLGLWFMVRKSTPLAAVAGGEVSAERSQLDSALSRLGGDGPEMFGRTKEIVGRFYESSNVRQVGVDKLKKNPFEAEKFSHLLKQIHELEESEPASKGQQTAKFELLTICELQKGRCCMIGDEVLYEGDSMKGFEVSQIGEDFVKLQSQDGEITLEIER